MSRFTPRAAASGAGALAFSATSLLALGGYLLHRLVNDRTVPVLAPMPTKPGAAETCWQAGGGEGATGRFSRVLAVFAHPDDEVMVAGTLAKLHAAGAETHLLYLTHGEDGPTGGLASRQDLGAVRAAEVEQVGRVLQVDSVELLDFPDRYLNDVPQAELTAAVMQRINQLRPDTLICFDHQIGLYGNPDHACAGRVVQDIWPESGAENLLIMTLPEPMIRIALRVSQTFQERYRPATPADGLPQANCCVSISRFAKQKRAVIEAHQTQRAVMNDVQPLWDKLPYWIYYRVFAKEYFQWLTNQAGVI